MLIALINDDLGSLQNLCRTSWQFADICRDDQFWQGVLLTKGWAPDWSTIESPGGMTPKAYYVMICGLNDAHRAALLELSPTTTTIKKMAFAGCTSLALKHLPSSLTSVGKYAFLRCTSLALAELPPTLNWMDSDAFGGCTSLALTKLPHTLTSIRDGVFSGCTSLALTELPPALVWIGFRSFANCRSLSLAHLPETITSISNYAFLGCPQLRGGEFEMEVREINPNAM